VVVFVTLMAFLPKSDIESIQLEFSLTLFRFHGYCVKMKHIHKSRSMMIPLTLRYSCQMTAMNLKIHFKKLATRDKLFQAR
jgi:uncharacterized protein with PQ loop repeat